MGLIRRGRALASRAWVGVRRLGGAVAGVVDGRDLHIYGGLSLIGWGLVERYGTIGLAVPGFMLFVIGVFGIVAADRTNGG